MPRTSNKESEELLAKQREREARHSGFDIGGELSAAQNRSASSRTRAGRAAAPANPFAALPKSKETTEKPSKPFNLFDQIKK
ncbi:hypothetical protein PP175_11645 [Aneurinibacillus sp. Ricciae_BoGa-3]|uniref:hypothetical protein n=1 Tax=Aneurinibacillus sp. Ricciae_BoGa-3 TaxID=3022697 RepID=UPI00233FF803|nr:hypothetical protein [Aneurinibacillus sp. Ricciae_BoGa-3]WCK56499.1 hypothetical protein PP175_11645 [Aneurinibacillus sp. Ricciae_BoGa-3]